MSYFPPSQKLPVFNITGSVFGKILAKPDHSYVCADYKHKDVYFLPGIYTLHIMWMPCTQVSGFEAGLLTVLGRGYVAVVAAAPMY